MKKIISKIILIAAFLWIGGTTIYYLYIMPLVETKAIDRWYDYIVAIYILTISYGLLIIIASLLVKLFDWAISNINHEV
jgi:hypothetical protein